MLVRMPGARPRYWCQQCHVLLKGQTVLVRNYPGQGRSPRDVPPIPHKCAKDQRFPIGTLPALYLAHKREMEMQTSTEFYRLSRREEKHPQPIDPDKEQGDEESAGDPWADEGGEG